MDEFKCWVEAPCASCDSMNWVVGRASIGKHPDVSGIECWKCKYKFQVFDGGVPSNYRLGLPLPRTPGDDDTVPDPLPWLTAEMAFARTKRPQSISMSEVPDRAELKGPAHASWNTTNVNITGGEFKLSVKLLGLIPAVLVAAISVVFVQVASAFFIQSIIEVLMAPWRR